MPTTPPTTKRPPSPRGFTLTELMVVLTIVAAMTAMSLPSFHRAIEQSRVNIAAANLRAIWSAERLYWLESHCYTSSLDTLKGLGLLDQAIPTSETSTAAGGYCYAVDTNGSTTLSATATRTGSPQWSGVLTISADGEITGAITAPDSASLTPEFQ